MALDGRLSRAFHPLPGQSTVGLIRGASHTVDAILCMAAKPRQRHRIRTRGEVQPV